jgi:GNAT superfamily N-acetyltransferase
MPEALIEQLKEATPEAAVELSGLLKQLTKNAQRLDAARLKEVIEASAVYVARVDGKIVGTVCRVDLRHLVRTKCWIEDVVVDESARGQGLAHRLMQTAISEAPKDAISVNLNSSMDREQSHHLYEKLGFKLRENTRIWRLELSH